MDVSILHVADLHLASSFKGLPPAMGRLRRRDLMQTLSRLTALCRERQSDFLVVAGDLWERAYMTRPLVDFVADQFRKIPGTNVLITPGQAEGEYENSFYSRYPWPENVHVFAGNMTDVFFPKLNLKVFGMAQWATALAAPDWEQLNAAALGGSRAMVVAYGNPESLSIPPGLTAQKNIIYVALGGAHRHTVWEDKMRDPGCPEPLCFTDSEGGVLLGTVGDRCELEYFPSASRRLVQMDIEAGDCVSADDATRLIEAKLAEYDAQNDFFNLKLVGARGGRWDASALETTVPMRHVVFQDETEFRHIGLAQEHPGVLDQFIKMLGESKHDSKVAKRALELGLEALLLGREARW